MDLTASTLTSRASSASVVFRASMVLMDLVDLTVSREEKLAPHLLHSSAVTVTSTDPPSPTATTQLPSTRSQSRRSQRDTVIRLPSSQVTADLTVLAATSNKDMAEAHTDLNGEQYLCEVIINFRGSMIANYVVLCFEACSCIFMFISKITKFFIKRLQVHINNLQYFYKFKL